MGIDIKDFIPVSRLPFVEGVFKKVEKNLEGEELEFYHLDKDVMDKVIKQDKINMEDDAEFLYTFIPLLSNVEMTITKDEFKKLCKVPSLQFANYIDLLMEHFMQMYETAAKLNEINTKYKTFGKENKIWLPVKKAVRTKEMIESEIDGLYESALKDKENRKKIQVQIAALEKELEEVDSNEK